MPIFEYHCGKCDHDFEELVRSSGEKIKCPKCNSSKVKKQMSASTFKSGSKTSAGSSCSGCSSSSCSSCH